MLGNFTSLEHLDLSHNDLHDLTTEANIFNLPENITTLRLSHNSLQNLPTKNIAKMKHLSVLDVTNNELRGIDYELIKKIEQGLVLQVNGKPPFICLVKENILIFPRYFPVENPINCDCHLRPLSHFFGTLMTDIPEVYTNITCHSPKHIENVKLIDVPDDHLNCVNNNETWSYLDVLPDLKFRDIH